MLLSVVSTSPDRELGKIPLDIFTNRKSCDIMVVPNELNNRTDRYVFLYGITILFFAHHKRYPFGKNATPVSGVKMPISV